MAVSNLHREVSIGLLKSTSAYAVRTPKGQKDPGHIPWDPKANTAETSRQAIHELERGNDNLGIHVHGTVVDVDVDTDNPLVMEALDYFLPYTAHVWGRPSRPRTHRLYEVVPPIGEERFDPRRYPFLEAISKRTDLSVEIRGGDAASGEYSLLPGSYHPSGEEYTWEDLSAARSTPVAVSTDRVVNGVRYACVAALIAPYWTEGVRNDLCMAFSGFLHRVVAHVDDLGSVSGLIFEKQDAEQILRGVMHIADDDEADEAMRLRTFEDTWKKGDEGKPTRGGASLAKLTGDDNLVSLLYTLLADSPDLIELDKFMERYAVRNGTSNIIDREKAGSRSSNFIMTVQDFRNSNMHKVLAHNGRERIQMTNVLLASPRAIRVDGMCFRPNQPDIVDDHDEKFINQWRGWAIPPGPGPVEDDDIAPFLNYVKTILASGHEVTMKWILDWLADIFKYPSDKIGTALVLVGKPGSGKSFLGEHIMRPIIGRNHYMTTNDISTIVGQFNPDSANNLMVQCDEALNSNRRQDALRLKSMITDSVRRIEPKYVNAYEVEDCTRYLITSNEISNAIAIVDGQDDRRYTVIHVCEDYAYKSRVTQTEKRRFWEEMHSWVGVNENLALLHRWFLQRETDRAMIRDPLDTKARKVMQQHSQRGFDDWLMQIVSYEHPLENLPERDQRLEESYVEDKAGALTHNTTDWPNFISYRKLEDSYEFYRRRKGNPGTIPTYNAQQIKGEFMARNFFPGEPEVKRASAKVDKFINGQYKETTRRLRVTRFPKRGEILAYLEDKYGFEVNEPTEDFGEEAQERKGNKVEY